MAEIEFEFPALYKSAGLLSAESQRNYLWSLRFEYALLIVCSAMSINQVSLSSYYYLYTLLFCLALSMFLWRFVTKPEQVWYQARALAESVKTSSWRFCMKSAPFDDESASDAIADFQEHLRSILAANRFAGTRLPSDFAAENQVTAAMLTYRQASLEDRMKIYEKLRIQDQRRWYAKKAGLNKRSARFWAISCATIYAMAIISSLTRAANPNFTWLPTEVLITIASTIVGWVQIKKFNELAASYILTAHEIGILHGAFTEIQSDTLFAHFVNEAEQAFSREHTQWVARIS